jgi:Holliday junction resolvase RusA-like endonuclease
MMPHITISVTGDPIPQGSKTANRYGRMWDDNAAKLKPWRGVVRAAALAALQSRAIAQYGGVGQVPFLKLAGPVRVEVTFTLKKPASAPKRRRTWPAKQRSGDVDKLTRAIFDSLTDAGVWGDDAQVVEVLARKTYPLDHPDALDKPGALIRIWPMNGDQ